MLAELSEAYRQHLINQSPNMSILAQINHAQEQGSLHPVISSLVTVASSANPLSHPEHQKLGLGIEGGGIAGSTTCYEAAALEAIGWLAFGVDIAKCFNVLTGSSSGSANLIYFAKGRARLGANAYTEHFSKPPFLNSPISNKPPYFFPKVLMGLREAPLLNLDYLVQLIKADQIGCPNPNEGDPTLSIIATNANPDLPPTVEARKVHFDNFESEDELLAALRGGMHLPFLNSLQPYNNQFSNNAIFDGGFVEHVPAETLSKYGCTRNLILTAIPGGADKKMHLPELVMAHLYRRLYNRGVGQLWLSRVDRLNSERRRLIESHNRPESDTQYCVVKPAETALILGTTESNPLRIKQTGKAGAEAVFDAFGIIEPQSKQELISLIFS